MTKYLLSLFWDNQYLPTDELHQKTESPGEEKCSELLVCSCLCVPDLKDVLMGPDKFYNFDIFGELGMDVPKLLGIGQNWFWHWFFPKHLEYSQIPKRKSKYLYPNSKRQQGFFSFTRSQYKESLGEECAK